MNPRTIRLAAAALAAAFVTAPAFAQDTDPPAIAARVAFLSGSVSLEPAATQDWVGASLNYPMVSGDRIFVDNGGRAIVQSGPTDVRIWGGSDVTLTNLNEQYEQVGIAQGSVRVRVFSIDPGNTVEVDTPNGAVIIQDPGDYRINVYPDEQASLVEVVSGDVQIAGPGVNQEVDQGQAVQLYGSNPVDVGAVEMLPPDGLDAWSLQRDRHIMASVSARYVNTDTPGYDDLDDYGDWTPASDYGPIWFPRSMPYGWQPYTLGHWTYIAPWGYTWVDDAAWGYAPFHYGRWVQWQGRWGWVPGPPRVRPVYAPAFVAFVGGGPGFSFGVSFGGGGVAAWFPLGVAEPYVPWYPCSPAYVRTVNVTNVNITVIRNVTIVNNYNVFINRVATVRSVNQIQVSNINYVNRSHVFAVNASVMTSGARVQQGAIRLNAQQQQALVRAPIAVARPPVAPPAHPVAGVRVNVSRPPARPVLMTPRGRVAATPAANAPHFTPSSLPRPKPASQIRPAAHPVAPNLRPAAPGNKAGRPGSPGPSQPKNVIAQPPRSNQPPGTARPPIEAYRPAPRSGGSTAQPAKPNASPQPNRPAEPNRPAQSNRPTQPNRPGAQPHGAPSNKAPATPHAQPQKPNNGARPAPSGRNPPSKNPPPKNEKKKPAEEENPPQR